MARTIAELDQYGPVNAVGPSGKRAVIGTARIDFVGNTGLVGTIYGMPGLSATRVGTGHYGIQFPASQIAYIQPTALTASGTYYNVHVQRGQNSISGTATVVLSSVGAALNPVSGTQVRLTFFFHPITPY